MTNNKDKTLKLGFNNIEGIVICLLDLKSQLLNKAVGADLEDSMRIFGGFFTARFRELTHIQQLALDSEDPSLFSTRHAITDSDVIFIDNAVWRRLAPVDRSIILSHIKIGYEVMQEEEYLRVTPMMDTFGPRRSSAMDHRLVDIHGYSAMYRHINRYIRILVHAYHGREGFFRKLSLMGTYRSASGFTRRLKFIKTMRHYRKRA